MTFSKGSIVVPQGCDYYFSIYVTGEDGKEKDLSEYKARFRLADKTVTSRYIDILASDTLEYGECTVNDPSTGYITVHIKPHDKLKLPTNNDSGDESMLQANNIYSVVLIKNNDSETNPGEIMKVIQGDCYTEVEL